MKIVHHVGKGRYLLIAADCIDEDIRQYIALNHGKMELVQSGRFQVSEDVRSFISAIYAKAFLTVSEINAKTTEALEKIGSSRTAYYYEFICDNDTITFSSGHDENLHIRTIKDNARNRTKETNTWIHSTDSTQETADVICLLELYAQHGSNG